MYSFIHQTADNDINVGFNPQAAKRMLIIKRVNCQLTALATDTEQKIWRRSFVSRTLISYIPLTSEIERKLEIHDVHADSRRDPVVIYWTLNGRRADCKGACKQSTGSAYRRTCRKKDRTWFQVLILYIVPGSMIPDRAACMRNSHPRDAADRGYIAPACIYKWSRRRVEICVINSSLWLAIAATHPALATQRARPRTHAQPEADRGCMTSCSSWADLTTEIRMVTMMPPRLRWTSVHSHIQIDPWLGILLSVVTQCAVPMWDGRVRLPAVIRRKQYWFNGN